MNAPTSAVPTITVNVPVSDKLCADIMCTALEGGIGYWCAADRIVRTDGNEGDWRYVSFVAYDTENQDDDEEAAFKPATVDYSTIRLGLQRILSGEVPIRADLAAQCLTITRGEDEADIDAEAADCIVQAGLLGELMFG